MVGVAPSTQASDWYVQSYGEIVATAYEVHPHLLVFDCHSILDELAAKIPDCQCESRDEFLRWTKEYVRRRVREIERTERILAECKRIIQCAIHRNWPTHTLDGVGRDDFHAEVAALIHRYKRSFSRPGAKVTTRAFGLTQRHVRNAANKRNRRRALVEKHISQGGQIAGAISEAELVAERYSEAAASCS